MHKKSIIIMALVAVMLVSIIPVFAAKPTTKAAKAASKAVKSNQAANHASQVAKPVTPAAKNGLEKGKTDQLYLYEKDPGTWEIVEDGAWGKMNINKGKFVFNGHKLENETEYALICYQDDWPGTGSLLLGNATSNGNGNVHINGLIDYETLPSYVYEIEGEQVRGSKIWLVLAADFDNSTTSMTAWNPSEYLFEFDLLNKQVVTE
jgi:hypothetical protein